MWVIQSFGFLNLAQLKETGKIPQMKHNWAYSYIGRTRTKENVELFFDHSGFLLLYNKPLYT